MNAENQENIVPENTLSTEEFAKLNLVEAQSVRARVCRFGSYFGVQPVKLKNKRTAWPAVQVREQST